MELSQTYRPLQAQRLNTPLDRLPMSQLGH